jgi:hypothetical protein
MNEDKINKSIKALYRIIGIMIVITLVASILL